MWHGLQREEPVYDDSYTVRELLVWDFKVGVWCVMSAREIHRRLFFEEIIYDLYIKLILEFPIRGFKKEKT